MSEKKVELKYLEVSDTVEADITVNVREVLDKLNLKELKIVKEIVNEMLEQNNQNNQNKTIKIEIPIELYQEIANLCKINNLDTNKKIIQLLETDVFSAEIDYEQGNKHVFNF